MHLIACLMEKAPGVVGTQDDEVLHWALKLRDAVLEVTTFGCPVALERLAAQALARAPCFDVLIQTGIGLLLADRDVWHDGLCKKTLNCVRRLSVMEEGVNEHCEAVVELFPTVLPMGLEKATQCERRGLSF